MVDFISGINAPNPVQGTNKTQNKNQQKEAEATSGGNNPVDEVSISAEALDQAQAEQAARDTRSILQQQQEEALTRTGQKVDQLL